MIHIWIINFAVPFLIGFALALLCLLLGAAIKKPSKPFFETVLTAAFAGYIVATLYVTLDPAVLVKIGFSFSPDVNWRPFYQISDYITADIPPHVAVVNLLGNIVLFMPMGFLLPLLRKRRRPVWLGTLGAALFSLIIELLQLVTPRVSDIDDLILNTIGGLLGALVFWYFFPKRRTNGNTDSFLEK